MEGLTLQDVTYRLFRLRRLLTLAVGLPLIALLLTSLIGLGIRLDLAGITLLVLWTAFALWSAVRFPNGWMELAALTLTLTLGILLSPIAAALGVGPILGGLLLIALMLFGMFRGTLLLIATLSAPMRQLELTFRRKVKMDKDTLRSGLFLRPDATVGLHTCGPADENGFFPVTANGYALEALDLGCGELDATAPISFWARIEESSPDHQVTHVFSESRDLPMSMEEQTLTDVRGGVLYEKIEIVDQMDRLSALGFWLNDVDADHFTALRDHLEGARPKALKLATQESMLIALAMRLIGGEA